MEGFLAAIILIELIIYGVALFIYLRLKSIESTLENIHSDLEKLITAIQNMGRRDI